MKSIFIATVLVLSSFAIATPANSQSAIVAALYQNPPIPQTELRYESAEPSSNQIIIAVNSTPEFKAIAYSLTLQDSYDRVVTISKSDNLACLVNGSGSADGAVTCGFIDNE
ncbi:MAG: hypothetical protein DCE90_16675 [Pseudanabaena sp.]|nr:MAG: hypothetical protein DCE90_16675 [Pseudanabaena sp.]